MENDVFDLKFGFQSIKKIRSKVKFERKAEFNILLDEPLYMMNIFNFLSNNNQMMFDGLSPDTRQFKGFAPFTTLRMMKEDIKTKVIRLDVVIKQEQLLADPLREHTKEQWRKSGKGEYDKNFAGLRAGELPLWWFEDVNFLGQGTPLTFNRDNSSIQEMTFPFIFKRLAKVDRQFRHGTNQKAYLEDGDPKDPSLAYMRELTHNQDFIYHNAQKWYYN
jgi:hypothetical protein